VPYRPRPDTERVHLELAGGVVLDLRLPHPHRAGRHLLFTVTVTGPNGATSPNITGKELRMRLLDNQQVTITVSEVDAFGDPVPADKRGQLTAVSSDDAVVTVDAPEDGSTGVFVVTAVTGADGVSASVLVTDDVNQDGTGDFQGSVDFDLVDHRRGQVAQLVVEAGEPVTKPVAPA
jgi:hypothetical protein